MKQLIMLLMCALLIFPATDSRAEIVIKKPSSVKIESSWNLLTDKAEIKLPRNVRDFDKQNVKQIFKRGDKVEINLGYNGKLKQEFTGFITEVSADYPVVIRCEDAMWELKQTMVSISLQQTTLPDLLKQIVPSGYDVDAIDAKIGTVRYSNETLAKVLDDIKSKYGFYSYMKGNTLVSGKIYLDDNSLEPVAINMEKEVIKNNLKYKIADDTAIRLRAVSTLKDGKTIIVNVGDEKGEQRQLAYYDIESEEDLKAIALNDLERLKRDALDGDFKTFGYPFIKHGMKADMVSVKYPDRDGIYYADATTKVFDKSPMFRQTIETGQKTI